MVRRTHLALITTIGAAATLAPAASAATLTVSPSQRQVIVGTPLTVKVTSDTAGEIIVRQARSGSKRDYTPGCYGRNEPNLEDGKKWIGGVALATITYTTPGVPVTVKVNSGNLGFFGGDLLSFLAANSRPGHRCYDPPTQFTRISAWQAKPGVWASDVGYAPLVRII